MRSQLSGPDGRHSCFAALVAATALFLTAFSLAGAVPAGASIACIPGAPNCPIKPPPSCPHTSTPLGSTLAQPVTAFGGTTVETTATATSELSPHGDLCLPVVLLTYHAVAPIVIGVKPYDVHLSVSADLHDGTTTTHTTPITITVHPGGTADAHDQSVTLADSFTPIDLLLINAG